MTMMRANTDLQNHAVYIRMNVQIIKIMQHQNKGERRAEEVRSDEAVQTDERE